MSRTRVKVGGHVLTLTNLEKVFYPETGCTKGHCIDYYSRIAPVLLPYLHLRPLTLKRYPEGVEGNFFYEKQCPGHRPKWMPTVAMPSERRGQIDFCTVENKASLIWVINSASIELHTLLMQENNLRKPSWVVFDLDPGPPAGLFECIPIALQMRDMLKGLGLKSFPKTSGGKGLHFYLPLNTPATFAQTKSFARTVAQVMEKEFPDAVVSKMSKQLREGKVLVDWSQNDEHKSTVSVYSLRAHTHPTVSTPLEWRELEEALIHKNPEALHFEYNAVLERVKKKGDIFKPVLELKQKLPS